MLGAWCLQGQRIGGLALEPRPAPAQAASTSLDPIVDLPTQYERALRNIEAGDTGEGVALLRRLADVGFAMAQFRLAKIYEHDQAGETNLALARRWTERAANAGNVQAMHDLGVFFSRDETGPRDEATAFRWFRQAADYDLADSQFNLGVLYEQGRGVAADPAEALFWFMLAARHGDDGAAQRVAALEAELNPMQIEQARARAGAFIPRAPDPIANGVFAAPARADAPAAQSEPDAPAAQPAAAGAAPPPAAAAPAPQPAAD
jgi:localization factor PodJL